MSNIVSRYFIWQGAVGKGGKCVRRYMEMLVKKTNGLFVLQKWLDIFRGNLLDDMSALIQYTILKFRWNTSTFSFPKCQEKFRFFDLTVAARLNIFPTSMIVIIWILKWLNEPCLPRISLSLGPSKHGAWQSKLFRENLVNDGPGAKIWSVTPCRIVRPFHNRHNRVALLFESYTKNLCVSANNVYRTQ